VTVIFGRNGAGKTTLLRVAVGLAGADAGVVIYRGERYRRPRLATLAVGGLFFIPERGLLAAWFTLREHFRLLARTTRDARIDDAITTFGLETLLDRRPNSFSTGERRRAEVGLAMARGPRCLVADEPLQSLAPLDADLVIAGLRQLASGGAAIIVSGHEVHPLMDVADDVLWLHDGRTRALGRPSRASEDDEFRRAYLGPAA
jgi:ABC-type multidrug transport system ATPase subunit